MLLLFILYLRVISSLSTSYVGCDPRNFSTNRSLNGTFLHITDIHIDPNYLPLTAPSELCHRRSTNSTLNTAGKFGALGTRCDSPIRLVDESFQFMKSNFNQVDFIIYTGDSARHDRDTKQARTGKNTLDDHILVTDYFNKFFNLTKTLVIPTIGNNDALFHNQIEEGKKEPIYKSLLEIWSKFKGLDILVKDSPAQLSFLKGGYWLQSLPATEGVKVINLNSMFFYVANERAIDCDKPGSFGKNMLTWYEGILNELQSSGKKAYIMGHIPPKDELGNRILIPSCYRQYLDITGRFSNLILAQFWGHTNTDIVSFISKSKHTHNKNGTFEFHTMVSEAQPSINFTENEIVSVMTTGPSITPVHHPAIRQYYYSPQNFDLLGYYQYYANVTEANQRGSLEYKVEYDTWSVYGLNSLSLDNWKLFLNRLVTEENLWEKYKYYLSVGADLYLRDSNFKSKKVKAKDI